MIKVLGLALYAPLAASNRYRLGQYVSGLAEFGIDLSVFHLFSDEYLRRRFSSSGLSITSVLRDGFNRMVNLSTQFEYDVIVLHCELFPFMPSWLERALLRKPYIYDFDDAFYLKYRMGRLSFAKPVLGDKFDDVITGAAAVFAGNGTLANYASEHNPKTYLMPTVVDTARYKISPSHCERDEFTVGWIGSPSTAAYLSIIVDALTAIGQEGPVRFIVIGGSAPDVPNVAVQEVEWSELTEIDLINSFDVGVMPLPDDAWARGKCAFKLIQYMACAVPVIASPVGANVDVVTPECGFLASTTIEWVDAFRILRDQPGRRVSMGTAGRNRVSNHYSLAKNLPLFAGVISAVSG